MSVSQLKTAAMSVGVLALVILMVMAVVIGFENSGSLGTCNRSVTTDSAACGAAESFVTGIAIFGTFASIVVLALLGKAVISIVSKGKKD